MSKAVSNGWFSPSDEYVDIVTELKKHGSNHVKTLFFMSYFTLGFAFFKLFFYGEYDSEKIIRILFDESLFAFSFLTFIVFSFAFLASEKILGINFFTAFLRWVAECSYEFTFGLIIVYMVGFAVDAPVSVNSLPWFDLSATATYVCFMLFMLLFIISIGVSVFVKKTTKNKDKLVKMLFFTTFIFLAASVYANSVS